MTYNVLLSILFLFAVLIVTIWWKFFYRPKQILKGLVAQGARNAGEFELDPYDDYTGLKKAIRENPDLRFTARAMPGKVYLSFLDPNLIKEIITNHHYYEKLNKHSVTSLLIGKSIILSDGISWKLHRSLLSEVFQYSFFNSMIPTIIQTTDQVLSFSKNKEIQVTLPNVIELITADVATSTFFGVHQAHIKVNGHKAPEELSEITEKVMKYAMSPLRFFPGIWALNFFKDYRDLKRRIKTLRGIFNDIIQGRIQEIKARDADGTSKYARKETDVLEILLQQRLKYNDDPAKTLNDEEILDDFFVFSVAGKDTTSGLVSMTLYCCEKYPKWGAKLKEEVERTITTPEAINLDFINSMSFMSAFLNEVLRVFPPASVFLPRKSTRDHYVGDLFIEKGTIFTISVVGMNYNPKFFDEPEKFNPTRWLKDDTNNENWKGNPFSFLPFSGGSRNCIGKHFALIEAKVILSLILKHFVVKLDPSFIVKMSYIGVAYLPREPIPFTFTSKRI